MNLIEATINKLAQVQFYLDALDDQAYQAHLEVLSYASIGAHTRHIIEFYQCLLDQCSGGKIDYDQRNRSNAIEEGTDTALAAIETIIDQVRAIDTDQRVKLAISYDSGSDYFELVDTSVERELVYNLEHVIHHLAIIKIGLAIIAPGLQIPEGFGVAPSTIKYQKSTCAQ